MIKILVLIILNTYFLNFSSDNSIYNYFKKIQLELDEKISTVIILNLDDCERCIDFNLRIINKIKKNNNIIIVLSYKHKHNISSIESINDKYKTVVDSLGLYSKFHISSYSSIIRRGKNKEFNLIEMHINNMTKIDSLISEINRGSKAR